jgi:hypothetical protein
MRRAFIKTCQNTPQLCWGDEWPPSPLGERVRVRGKSDFCITPTLILPNQGGGISPASHDERGFGPRMIYLGSDESWGFLSNDIELFDQI